MLNEARGPLSTRAGYLADEEYRVALLKNAPAHREIVAGWGRHALSDGV
jgi:hypothetical protein